MISIVVSSEDWNNTVTEINYKTDYLLNHSNSRSNTAIVLKSTKIFIQISLKSIYNKIPIWNDMLSCIYSNDDYITLHIANKAKNYKRKQ